MADPISFDPFLGWVDVENPNSIPEDARLITAADLLRYENWGKDGSALLNAVAAAITDAALAALAADPASALHAAVNPGGGWSAALLPVSVKYVPADSETLAIPNNESPYTDLKTGITELTYTVPPSGAVQVDLSGPISSLSGCQIYWQLTYGHNGANAGHNMIRESALVGWAHASFRVAGDTPGTVRTLKWQHRNATASTGNTMPLNNAGGKYLSMSLTPLG
jgi:hypothetical protein